MSAQHRARTVSGLLRTLLWLLGGMVAVASCGPALTSQVQLNEMGTRARKDCEGQKRRMKCEIDPGSMECAHATLRCHDALKCAEAVQSSVEETQRVQLRRSTIGASSAEETVVQLKYDSAVLECRGYRMGAILPPTDAMPKPLKPSPVGPGVPVPISPVVPIAPSLASSTELVAPAITSPVSH